MLSQPPPLPSSIPMAPLPENRRYDFPDVLRGFAVGGIFLVNIAGFKSPSMVTTAVGELMHGGFWNTAIEGAVWTLAMAKFMPLFAMLFGLGMALQYRRSLESGRPFTGFFVRRSLWLLLFGVLHAAFFWAGDVLAIYAVFGLMGLVLVARTPKVLLALAGGLFAIFLLVSTLLYSMPDGGNTQDVYYGWLSDMGEWWLRAYRDGSFGEIVLARLAEWGLMNAFSLYSYIPQAFAFFIFGIYLGKADWIRRVNARTTRGIVACALPAGVVLSVIQPIFLLTHVGPQTGPLMGAAMAAFWIGGLLLSLSYAGVLFLMLASGGCRGMMTRLAATGRMALTNYLLQSIIASLLFTNYGLGWYGGVSAIQGVLIVAVIYGLQLYLSPVWLRYFEFGPFEWLWRALAYGKRPPFLRRRACSGITTPL
jgi:uncharacterized protein